MTRLLPNLSSSLTLRGPCILLLTDWHVGRDSHCRQAAQKPGSLLDSQDHQNTGAQMHTWKVAIPRISLLKTPLPTTLSQVHSGPMKFLSPHCPVSPNLNTLRPTQSFGAFREVSSLMTDAIIGHTNGDQTLFFSL